MLASLKSRLTNLEGQSTWIAAGLGAFVLFLLGAILLGIHWSQPPEQRGIDDILAKMGPVDNGATIGNPTVSTLIFITQTLLEKPGGYLSNDVTPPGLWLDNMPKLGVWCVGTGARSSACSAQGLITQSVSIY